MTGEQRKIGQLYSYGCSCYYADSYVTETRGFNTNGQLASMGWDGSTVQYQYSATQNNGQITQSVDAVSGETTAYQYDSLKRLITATATNTSTTAHIWRQDYGYDGFGNLTSKAQNGGAPVAIPVTASTNRLTNASCDLNGNMTSGSGATMVYDVVNRLNSAQLVSGGTEYYAYTADSKRIFRKTPAAGSTFTEEWTMYGARGEKLGSFTMPCAAGGSCNNQPVLNPTISFAGRTIWDKGAEVRADRLGTNRANGAKFYPYGEEITSTTNDRVKFGTYTRDGFTGLDYADQRFYASTYGRFNTADPSNKNIIPADPRTWNAYAYTNGDPVNNNDPDGLQACSPSDPSCYPNDTFDQWGGDNNWDYERPWSLWSPDTWIQNPTTGAFLSNGYGAVAISQSFFDTAVLSGAISIGANGSVTFGGIVIAVSEVAIAANPIVLTVAGVAAVGTLAYYTYQFYEKQSQAGQARDISKAWDQVKRDCGRTPTPEERGKIHDQITGQDLSVGEIVDIMKGVMKCR